MATAPRLDSPPLASVTPSSRVEVAAAPVSNWNGYSVTSCASSCCRALKNGAFHAAFVVIQGLTGCGAGVAFYEGNYIVAGLGAVCLGAEVILHGSLYNSGRLVAAAEDVSLAARFTRDAGQRAHAVARANEAVARSVDSAATAVSKAADKMSATVDPVAVEALGREVAGAGALASAMHTEADAMHAHLSEMKTFLPLMLSLMGSFRTSLGVIQRGESTVGPTLAELHDVEMRLQSLSATLDTNVARGVAEMKDVFRLMMEHMIALTNSMSSEIEALRRQIEEKTAAFAAAATAASGTVERLAEIELQKFSLVTKLGVIALENKELQEQLARLIAAVEEERAAWARDGATAAGAIRGATADLAAERAAFEGLLASAKRALAISRSGSLSRSSSRDTED